MRHGHVQIRTALTLIAVALAATTVLLPSAACAATSIDARSYGMVGNNTKDNSAALLRACRAGVNKGLPVVIPAGRYRLASTVTLPVGVKLRGSGGAGDPATDGSFKGTWLRGRIRVGSNSTVSNMKIGDQGSGVMVTIGSRNARNVRFTNVRFRGGDPSGSTHAPIFVVGYGTYTDIDGLYITDCKFERNLGRWDPNCSAGAFNVACDTSTGDVQRNIWIRGCRFGVTNGVKKGQPTFNIVCWQSEESGTGYWTGVHIINNTFETTDEFNLDFDGLRLRDNGKNVVEIRGNLIKGGGKIRPDGSRPTYGYTICTEPTREGTVIEDNKLFRGYFNVFKTTKDTTDTVFRNNVIDLTVANGVQAYYDGSFRTINLFDGARNRVTGNTIYVPAGESVSSEVIYNAEDTSVVSSNRVVRK